MPRLFSGIEIPASIARRLTLVRAGLTGARWIDPENYHVTLRFLGDVDGATARDFAHSLGDIAAAPFELRLERLGSFGGRKPRAIFAAVAPSEAARSRCNGRMSAPPAPPACRRSPATITPHVTVARLRGASSEAVATISSARADSSSEPFEVSRFVLFSSRASVGGGPYVVEAAYPLED